MQLNHQNKVIKIKRGKVDDYTLAKIDSRLLISFGIHGGS